MQRTCELFFHTYRRTKAQEQKGGEPKHSVHIGTSKRTRLLLGCELNVFQPNGIMKRELKLKR